MSSETWTADSLFVDTGVFVLLIVGLVDPTQIGKGKTTSSFTQEQFKQLSYFLASRTILVTPHVLTETSNLLERDKRCMAVLQQLMKNVEERSVDAKAVCQHPRFFDVGVCDAVLLELITPRTPLLTADRPLWAIANARERRARLFPIEPTD